MIDLRLLRSERRQSSPLFWARYPGLVWSNCRADDLAYIFAALLKPHFDIILDICVEFGLEWVEAEWQALLLHGEAAKVNRASSRYFMGTGTINDKLFGWDWHVGRGVTCKFKVRGFRQGI